MSKTPWTPGEWRFSFESTDPEWAVVTTSGGAVIANVNADHRQDANARLIAAAPDMAEAHDENARILGYLVNELQGRIETGKLEALNKCLQRSLAMSAKARGDQ